MICAAFLACVWGAVGLVCRDGYICTPVGLHGVFCLTYGCVCVHLCTPGSLRPACGLGGWRRLPQSVSVYSLEVPTGD